LETKLVHWKLSWSWSLMLPFQMFKKVVVSLNKDHHRSIWKVHNSIFVFSQLSSFQILFRGVLGVVRKSRGVLYFRVLLHSYDQIFWSLLRGYLRYFPPSPLCASIFPRLSLVFRFCIYPCLKRWQMHFCTLK